MDIEITGKHIIAQYEDELAALRIRARDAERAQYALSDKCEELAEQVRVLTELLPGNAVEGEVAG